MRHPSGDIPYLSRYNGYGFKTGIHRRNILFFNDPLPFLPTGEVLESQAYSRFGIETYIKNIVAFQRTMPGTKPFLGECCGWMGLYMKPHGSIEDVQEESQSLFSRAFRAKIKSRFFLNPVEEPRGRRILLKLI
jgi:hypothetical protein